MDLGKVKVEANDIVPNIKFYGETNFDKEQLKNVEDVKSIAFEAISRLWDVSIDTKGHHELSIKDIHNTADQAIKDIIEYLSDYGK